MVRNPRSVEDLFIRLLLGLGLAGVATGLIATIWRVV
jgi:hypothetical protein